MCETKFNQLARKFNASEPKDHQRNSVKVLSMVAVIYLFQKIY